MKLKKGDWDEGFNNEWQPMHEQIFWKHVFGFWYVESRLLLKGFYVLPAYPLDFECHCDVLWFSEEVKFEI